MKYLIYIILIFVILFFLIKFLKKFKVQKIGALALVTGGVKCGKSTFAVYLAIREYKSRLRSVKFANFFNKLFKKPLRELPLLYSNIPLSVPYVELTDNLLLRKERFVFGSVIYVCEASLVADSQLLRDKDINEQLQLFNKLIGHETKGGCIIYDTQSIGDLHYSIKRCLSEFIYIHHLVKIFPFFLIAYVREDRYSDDGAVLSVNTDDSELTLRKVLIPKSTWKKFDCYCYSSLTDNLPVNDNVITNNNNLKATKIVSFRTNFKDLKGGKNIEKN